jgi:hypothetical protein
MSMWKTPIEVCFDVHKNLLRKCIQHRELPCGIVHKGNKHHKILIYLTHVIK